MTRVLESYIYMMCYTFNILVTAKFRRIRSLTCQFEKHVLLNIFLKKEGKTDYSKAGSYRPISITSYIGKVFEQIIANRIEQHLRKKGLSDEYQEGFTKKRNTVRYLNRLDNDIRSHLQKKYTVICLFIDFEKAFDSVWK